MKYGQTIINMQKMKLDHLLISHPRINSKWIKNLNVRPQTIKILEENIGSKILNIAHRYFLLIFFPRQGKQKIKKQRGLHQTKKVLHSKGNHQQQKKTTHRIGEIFTNVPDKGLISKIY